MRKELLPIVALGIWVLASPVTAEELAMPEAAAAPAPAMSMPAKGSTMMAVEGKYGAPTTKHPTVGGGSPRQPPITRWDYPGFTVVFENDKVIDAVVPGAPPALATRKGLQQVDVPAAMPSVSFETPVEAPVEAPVEPAIETPVAAPEAAAAPAEMPMDAPAEPAMEAAPEATQPQYETPAASPPPAEETAAEQPSAPVDEPDMQAEPMPLP